MEESCPPTPLHVMPGRNSKSPTQMTISSPESDGKKSPSGRLSPDSRCVICLGRLQKKSFTDTCLHQFCFQCLLQWSKVKPECPLCKQPFKSIIHNVRSNRDYDQYEVERREPAFVVSEILHSYDFDLVPIDRRFRYRSTMTREYFREIAETFLSRDISRNQRSYQLPQAYVPPTYHIPPASGFRPRADRQRCNADDFRRNVYAQDLWVQDLVDVSGRYRECTPQFYRENPAQIHRIIPWLSREVNTLLSGNESHVAYVVDRIISLLPQHSIRSREFREAVQSYFGRRTEHFIHELYTFARSVYDISGFDLHAVYVPNPNYATEVQEISSTSDSDIELVNIVNKNSVPSRKRRKKSSKVVNKSCNQTSSEPVPGPSGICRSQPTETIEVCDSDTDEIKVINYQKPEPEIVTLSSDDERTTYERSSPKNAKVSSSSTQSKDTSSKREKKKPKSDGIKHKGRKRKISVSSSNSRSCSNLSSTSSSSTITNYATTFDSISTSASTSGPDGSTSDSSWDESSLTSSNKKKRKVGKSHRKKNKRSKSPHRPKTEDSTDHLSRKSKVKSCVVVPKSSESSEKKYRTRDMEYFKRGKGNEYGRSSLTSYWSLALGDKGKTRYRYKESKTEREKRRSRSGDSDEIPLAHAYSNSKRNLNAGESSKDSFYGKNSNSKTYTSCDDSTSEPQDRFKMPQVSLSEESDAESGPRQFQLS